MIRKIKLMPSRGTVLDWIMVFLLIFILIMFAVLAIVGEAGAFQIIKMQPYNSTSGAIISGGTIYGYGGNSGSAASSGTSYFTRTDLDGDTKKDRRTIKSNNFKPEAGAAWAVQISGINNAALASFPAADIASSGITLYFKESLKDDAVAWAGALRTTITVDVSIKTGNTVYAYPFWPTGGGYFVRIEAESGASDIRPTILVFIP